MVLSLLSYLRIHHYLYWGGSFIDTSGTIIIYTGGGEFY